MANGEAITIRAGETLGIYCWACATKCKIEHEPSASRNCPQDVPEQSYIYIANHPRWGGHEKPFVAMQVGAGWWHRFMSPTFATLQEAVEWAIDWCEQSGFALLPKSQLPVWFTRAVEPQEFAK